MSCFLQFIDGTIAGFIAGLLFGALWTAITLIRRDGGKSK